MQGSQLDVVQPQTREEWAEWLEANHSSSSGVWVAVHKKAHARGRLTYEEMVEEALRYGWIDSTVNRLDDERFIQLVTPRRSGSSWAPSNKERIRRLEAAGRMLPAGIAAVESAKADGSWTLLDSVERLEVPEDLQHALSDEGAAEAFESLPASQRKQALYWIGQAKRSATRQTRIERTVAAALLGRAPL